MGLGNVKLVALDEVGLVTPENANRMRSRVVALEPGSETGVHVTTMREELLIPLEGEATFIGPDGEIVLGPGNALYIPVDTRHNVVNRGSASIRYMYVLALFADYEHVKQHSH